MSAEKVLGDCWQARYGVGPCQDWTPCEDWRRFDKAARDAGYASGSLAAGELGLWGCTYDAAVAFVMRTPAQVTRRWPRNNGVFP